MRPFSEQFTLRGVVIGIFGCILITASSLYTALKLGALPWPIFFVVLLALFALRACARRGKNTNINEVNVSATMMSAGAMVAGGLAFTVPGLFILMPNAELPLSSLVLAALGGVALGCVGTALFRRQFIIEASLPYPIGTGAAETLKASFEGGKNALLLFISAAVALVLGFLRDFFALVPQLLLSWVRIPGVNFGIYCSPMALAMGFLIGPLAALVWFCGALIGDFGVVAAGVAAGLWDAVTAADIKMSLGIGVMIGCGVGVVIKMAGQFFKGRVRQVSSPSKTPPGGAQERSKKNQGVQETKEEDVARVHIQEDTAAQVPAREEKPLLRPYWILIVAAVVALMLIVGGVVSPVAAIILVVLVWVAMLMAAQSTGQAGLNPMEVFGIIVLLVVALFIQLGTLEAFLVAAVATVACGFVGDMMNDFKAGHLLRTNPKAQWIAECIGGVIGAAVAAGVFVLLTQAYGTDAFGVDKPFVAAQASAVAAMVGSIPNLPAFCIGFIAGVVLYVLKAPVITLGLGIYLPFYLSLTVAVGAAIRFVIGKVKPAWVKKEKTTIVASGLLAGESIAGVVIAFIVVLTL